MKKRGEVKVRSTARSVRRGRDLVSDIHSEIASTPQIVEKRARGVQGLVDRIANPLAFHLVFFVVTLGMLAAIFRSGAILFFAALTIGVTLFGRFLHKHDRRPHHVLAIIGVFFFPLLVTLALFRDTFMWLMAAVYVLSLISTVVIYLHQKKVKSLIHDPVELMWQLLYAKVVCLTLGILALVALPRLLFPDQFFSFFELSMWWLGPSLFVFFFSSEFLYLYLFDKKHWKNDVLKSVRYALLHSLALVLAVMCLYAIFASVQYGHVMRDMSSNLDGQIQEVETVKAVLDKQPMELKQLKISKEFKVYVASFSISLNVAKSDADSAAISLGSLLDDSYHADILDSVKAELYIMLDGIDVMSSKGMIADSYERIVELSNGTHFTGTDVTIEDYASALRAEFEAAPRLDTSSVDDLASKLSDASMLPSDFESEGIYWMAFQDSGVTSIFPFDIYSPRNIFESEMAFVSKHLTVVKNLAIASVDVNLLLKVRKQSSRFRESLIANSRDAESPLSEAVRYSVILNKKDVASEVKALSDAKAAANVAAASAKKGA